MENAQQINWLLEIGKIAIPTLVALIVPFITYRWITRKMADYQTILSKDIEDYKKDISKELETYKFQLQSDFYKFQSSLQEERERKRLFLQKLEEIHEQISNYKRYFNGLEINMFQLLVADKDIKKTSPIELKEFQFYKLRLFIGIYASELIEYVDKLEELSEVCRSDGSMYVLEQDETKSKERFAWFISCKNEILRTCNEIEKRIIEISKKHL